MNDLTTFYVIRHGQTDWNVKRIVQGHLDSELTQRGIDETKKLIQKLRDIRFDKVFSSDLLRAKRTAEIIAREKKLEVEATNLLREQPYGKYEGKPLDDMLDDLKEWEKLSEEAKFKYKLGPEFESDEESATRLINFLRELSLAYAGKNILIVSHGIIIKSLLHHLGYMKYSEDLFLNNSGFIKLESDGVDFFVKEVNGMEKDYEH